MSHPNFPKLTPSEYLAQCREAGLEKEKQELSDRDAVLHQARLWTANPPREPIEGLIHGAHPVTYTYEHDDNAYRIGEKIEWVNSGIQSFTWTFDDQSVKPVLDVLQPHEFTNPLLYENWDMLHRAVNGIRAIALTDLILLA